MIGKSCSRMLGTFMKMHRNKLLAVSP